MERQVIIRGLAEEEVFRVNSTLNSNNHHSYAPFRFVEARKKLFYHEEQYEHLYLPWGKQQLSSVLAYHKYDLHLINPEDWESKWAAIPVGETIAQETISHIPLLEAGDYFTKLNLDSDFFCSIYKLYSYQYNYHLWVEEVRSSFAQQPVLRMFSLEEVEQLTNIAKNRLEKGLSDSYDYFSEIQRSNPKILTDLAHAITTLKEMNKSFFNSRKKETIEKMQYRAGEEDYSFMDMLHGEDTSGEEESLPLEYPRDIEMFVKLCSSSAKNEKKPYPINTVEQIIDFITGRVQFLQKDFTNYQKYQQRFDCPIGVVLMPWNTDIEQKSEFRVFIRNREVVAISQQTWYTLYYYTSEEIETAIQSIVNLFYGDLQNSLPLPSAILDVSVQFDIQKAFLIEVNPWGTWATSGSALFDWVKDHDIIEPNLWCTKFSPQPIYFRFLHSIPYHKEMLATK